MNHKEVAMLMMLMAFLIGVIDQGSNQADHLKVPVPWMWDEHGHIQWPSGSILNLHPRQTIKESQKVYIPASLFDMPNLDPWVSFIDNLYVEELAPRTAMPDRRNQVWAPEEVDLVRFQLSGPENPYSFLNHLQHCPWHVTMQIHYPQLFQEEGVLYYGIIRKPSSDSPCYEALVSCMPNIRCKAKSIAELEQQFLKDYADYLSELVMRKEVAIEVPHEFKLPAG